MKVVLSHPTGNRNVRAVLAALDHECLLAAFVTTLAIDPDAYWLRWIPHTVRAEFLRRQYPIKIKQIETRPMRELIRVSMTLMGLKKTWLNIGLFPDINNIYGNIDKVTAKKIRAITKKEKIDAVYAYEDGALETFLQAKKMGIRCIYDLPIAYWETVRKLLLTESERLPHWAPTLGGGIKDSDAKLEKKTRELALADLVIVPSEFVRDSLPNSLRDSATKSIIAPFGSPEVGRRGSMMRKEPLRENRPMRVLFAGSMGQRKGLADLFEAVKSMKSGHIQLVVLGSLLSPLSFYRAEYADFIYEPNRSHEKVLELMRTCDVFCLPSIAEGRALVIQEAMSQGLPIIITPHTGCSDLVMEGRTGFLVPIQSPLAIAEKLVWFLDHRHEIAEMGKAAEDFSAQYTWKRYGETVITAIKSL